MLSDRLARKKQTECTRAQCAAEHLKRVAALTGAKQDDDGTYHLTAGGTHFSVDAKCENESVAKGHSGVLGENTQDEQRCDPSKRSDGGPRDGACM